MGQARPRSSDPKTKQALGFGAQGTRALLPSQGFYSRLIKLLTGLYQPNQGRILLDGLDLKEWSSQARRTQIYREYSPTPKPTHLRQT